ncbi:restriction endonuclease subunit S [Microcoleus sp. MON1_C5]|uniref:restriction endonuclease subunit S n=1 Tax=Microcoleus sp. MON1_C5 TaxID=2818828 RepID=UPI002FD6513D
MVMVTNVPEGYKETKVGLIPNDWQEKRLEDVSKLSSGTTPSRKLEERYYSNGNIYWVKTTDLNNSNIIHTGEKITELALNETCLKEYSIGTVLVAMYGGFNQIGRTGLLKIPAAVNQALIAIQPQRETLDSIFIINYLNFRVSYWKSVAISSRKDPNITSRNVKEFPIPLPPLSEQRAIAQALSDADAAIAELDLLITKKRNIKQGAMQELLAGRKTLPGFIDTWEVKTLREISHSIASGKSNSKSESGLYPVYGSTGIIGYNNNFDYCGEKILVARVGANAGTTNLVSGYYCVSDNTLIISLNQSVDIIFTYYKLVNYKLNTLVFGSGQPLITGAQLKNLLVSIPHISEQQAIAQVLTGMDAEIEALEQKRDKYKAIKQGMMQELLTGRTRLV